MAVEIIQSPRKNVKTDLTIHKMTNLTIHKINDLTIHKITDLTTHKITSYIKWHVV